MTPSQRLYCHALRVARGNSIALSEARVHAHRISAFLYSSPTNIPKLVETFRTYPWEEIFAPTPTRFSGHDQRTLSSLDPLSSSED